MSNSYQDKTAARRGALYLLLAAGTVPIIVSAVHGTHWDTYARWYALPTVLIVLTRFCFGWFRSLVWRVVGAGTVYLAATVVCSAVIAWWNWMAFVAIAGLGTLLALLLGRHAIRLFGTLGSEVRARLKRAWSRWRAERKQDRTGNVVHSTLPAGTSVSPSEPDGTDGEDEPDPVEGASGVQRCDTRDEAHAPRSRLGRLAGTIPPE